MPALLKKLSDRGRYYSLVILLHASEIWMMGSWFLMSLWIKIWNNFVYQAARTKPRQSGQWQPGWNHFMGSGWQLVGFEWPMFTQFVHIFCNTRRSNCDTWLGTEWALENSFDGKVDGPVPWLRPCPHQFGFGFSCFSPCHWLHAI